MLARFRHVPNREPRPGLALWVATPLLLIGCGARTGLLPNDRGASLPDASTPDASFPDATLGDAPVPDGPYDAPQPDAPMPPPGDCPSALLPGAPTPMRGYCSTRAYRTSSLLPVAPALSWTLPPPVPLAYQAVELVVDANGRTYASLDTDSQDAAVLPDTLMAFDAAGTLAWSHSFDDAVVSALFLAADGKLRFRLSGDPPSLAVMSRDGVFEGASLLPSGQLQDFAVGREGSLYTKVRETPDSQSVAKLTAAAALVWKSPPLALCSVGMSPIALGNEDHAVVTFATTQDPSCEGDSVARVVGLDTTGQLAWQTDIPGIWAMDTAIAPDGTVRVGVAETEASDALHLIALDVSGTILWDRDLLSTAINVWENPMAITRDGTTLVRTNSHIVAVSPSGLIVWRRPLDPMYAYTAVVDGQGMFVMTGWMAVGIDAQTGEDRWSLSDVLTPFVAGPSGSIVGTMSVGYQDMQMFLARDL